MWASLVAQLVKNPPAMQETWVWSLGWKDPLEKEMATHSSMDRGAWWAADHGVAKNDWVTSTCTHSYNARTWSSVWHLWSEVKVLVAQSCLTFCDPMDYSLPGSPVQGILQARILEWVAFLFSRGSSQPRDQTQVSRIVGGFFTSWATSPCRKPMLNP